MLILLTYILVSCTICIDIVIIFSCSETWQEVRLAIEYIVIPGGEAVELLPRCSEIVARQLELVESYQLAAEYSSSDPNPRLQILPVRLKTKNPKEPKSSSKSPSGEGTGISRLPLLPEWNLTRTLNMVQFILLFMLIQLSIYYVQACK